MGHPIWADDKLYSLLKVYVDWRIRRCYRSLTVTGLDRLDSREGAAILSPNHCGTLMDALVLLQTDRSPKVFGARADIFRKPRMAAAMTFLRIVPMVRERDGLHNVAQNLKTIDTVAESLCHGVPFVIFPEGTHRPQPGLQPLKKGICRIAMAAHDAGAKPVLIYPVGINYSDYFSYRCRAKINIGEPIDFTKMLSDRPEDMTDAEFSKGFMDQLRESMLSMQEPVTNGYRTPRAIRIFLAALTSPLFALAAVLASPQLVTSAVLVGRLKDRTWSNTMRFASSLVLLPLAFLIWVVLLTVLSCNGILSPLCAGAVILFSLFAQEYFYDWLNALR